METITLNRSIGRTRRETLGGRDYIVAPLSMLVPGVLNGSRGPLLYPPELVNRNPAVWNHMPIVVYHPMEQGKPTSARDPYILNKQGIGFVFRSRENGRAEGWFDVENTKRVDPRVYDALVKNQPMELSTGLFTKNQKANPGSNFRGKKYVEIVTDFTPDHLAILPDQKGACSMKDGCGMLINKEDGELTLETPQRKSRYRQLVETLQEVLNGSANQPRDARGRWSSGGSGGGTAAGRHMAGAIGGNLTKSSADKSNNPGATDYHHEIEVSDLGKGTEAAHSALAKAGFKDIAQSSFTHPTKGQINTVAGMSEKGSAQVFHIKQAAPKQSDSSAKSGASTGSHETVKQMQKQGNTTKLASALTKAEGIAKPTPKPKGFGVGKEQLGDKGVQHLQSQGVNLKAKVEGEGFRAKVTAPHPIEKTSTQLQKAGFELVDTSNYSDFKGQAGTEKRFFKNGTTVRISSIEGSKTTQINSVLHSTSKRPTQNLEGSQFGKPHNTVKEKPNMAKRQVNNEEPVELTDDDRSELIDMIVGNCECDQAQDAETLNSLSDELLSRLALNAIPPQFQKKKAVPVEEEAEEEEEMMDEEEMPMKKKPIQNSAKGQVKKIEKKVVTVNKSKEETPKLDAKTQFLVNYAERKMQEEKDLLIEKLTANVSEEDMDDMVETLNEEPIEKLERMVKLLPKEVKQPVQNSRYSRRQVEETPELKGRNFTGAGGALPKSQARQVNNSSKQSKQEDDPLAGPLESPTINYAEVAGFNNGNFIHRNNLGLMQSASN